MILAGWNNYAVSMISEISLARGVDHNKVVNTRISIIVVAPHPKKSPYLRRMAHLKSRP